MSCYIVTKLKYVLPEKKITGHHADVSQFSKTTSTDIAADEIW